MEDKMNEKVKTQVENKICEIVDEGLHQENIDRLYKLVDIHKDLANEDYWKIKEEDINMRYGTYGRTYSNMGNYGSTAIGTYGRRMRDSRGRYMGKGSEMKHKINEVIDEMYQGYNTYADAREAYGRGNYSAGEDSMQSLNDMLESVVDFMAMLKQDAKSQEELDLIKRYAQTIADM